MQRFWQPVNFAPNELAIHHPDAASGPATHPRQSVLLVNDNPEQLKTADSLRAMAITVRPHERVQCVADCLFDLPSSADVASSSTSSGAPSEKARRYMR
jgi:hypothetical protein